MPSSRYAAFLRGVNLGPHRRVSNEQLRSHFTAMGFEDVACFRSSGNVAFSSRPLAESTLRSRAQKGLGDALGYEVAVFIRDAAELHAIARCEPFEADAVAASNGKLQVSLLERAPPAATRRKALALASEHDRLALRGRELYWLPSGGLLESELDLDALARLLGADTRRTKATLELMADKHLPL